MSVLRQYSVDDRMTNAYGAVGAMRIGRANRVLGEDLLHGCVIRYIPHMT
jgi:hypothetical protein